MEEWGSLRYLLPAIAGGLGVFILIVTAQSTKNNNKCDFGIAPLSILLLGTIIFTYGAYALFFDNQPNDGLNDDVWLKPFFIMASIIFIGFTLDSWAICCVYGVYALVYRPWVFWADELYAWLFIFTGNGVLQRSDRG